MVTELKFLFKNLPSMPMIKGLKSFNVYRQGFQSMVRACTDFTGSLDPSNHGLVSAAAEEFAKGSLSRRTNFPNLIRLWIRRDLKMGLGFRVC